MTTLSLCTIVLASLGVVPGETTGWGTGEVVFRAYVRTAEHQEIYPVCAGQYTVEVVIEGVLDDPAGMSGIRDQSRYLLQQPAEPGLGQHGRGREAPIMTAPARLCSAAGWRRSVRRSMTGRSPQPPEEPNDIESPSVTTDSAEATETTVTFKATLEDDGGEPCSADSLQDPGRSPVADRVDRGL